MSWEWVILILGTLWAVVVVITVLCCFAKTQMILQHRPKFLPPESARKNNTDVT